MTRTEKRTVDGMRIFFTGVGGQGTLMATQITGEAALREGLPVSMSEIHGMAQRGGVVESSIVVGDLWSPTISDGEADVMVAFEPLEGLRALPKCHAGTIALVNKTPIVPFTVAAGQGIYPPVEEIVQSIARVLRQVVTLDATAMAREAGNEKATNIVMIGALAGLALLPVSRDSWIQAIKSVLPSRLHDLNLNAFEQGFREGTAAVRAA